jgi:hypothetical protein
MIFPCASDHFCGGQEGELGKVELYMMWGEDLKQEDAMLRPFGMVEFWDRDRNTRSGLGQGPSSGMKPHGGRLYDWCDTQLISLMPPTFFLPILWPPLKLADHFSLPIACMLPSPPSPIPHAPTPLVFFLFALDPGHRASMGRNVA